MRGGLRTCVLSQADWVSRRAQLARANSRIEGLEEELRKQQTTPPAATEAAKEKAEEYAPGFPHDSALRTALLKRS